MKEKAYLASPFFDECERAIYHKVIDYLRNLMGYDLYVPMEHTVEGAWEMSNAIWAERVFEEDIHAIDEAEIVFVINFGMYSDSGTAWECGYAYAKGKKVVTIIVAPQTTTYSLMMINGCDTIININNPLVEVSPIALEQK